MPHSPWHLLWHLLLGDSIGKKFSIVIEASVPSKSLSKKDMALFLADEMQYDPTSLPPESITGFRFLLSGGKSVLIPADLVFAKDRNAIFKLLKNAGVPSQSIKFILKDFL